jgi:head-tail adaptor
MYSGKFNRRIVILRATRTANAPNEWLDTWSRLAIVAAKRMDASAT